MCRRPTYSPRRGARAPSGRGRHAVDGPQPVHAAAPAVPAAVPLPAARPRQPGRRGVAARRARRHRLGRRLPRPAPRPGQRVRQEVRPDRRPRCCSSSPSLAIIVADAAPRWFCIAVLVREVRSASRSRSPRCSSTWPRFDVTWLGKTATFLLMFAIPGFMLGSSDFPAHDFFNVVSWILGIPGLVLSYWTAIDLHPRDPPRHRRRAGRRACRHDGGAGRRVSIRLRPMNVPEQLRYSSDHEWVSRDGDVVRIGITDYAQDALGDVVFVQVPEVGCDGRGRGRRSARSRARSRCPTSTPRSAARSSRSTRRWPTARRCSTRTPTATGWICTIRMSDPAEFDALLDAAAYGALIEG